MSPSLLTLFPSSSPFFLLCVYFTMFEIKWEEGLSKAKSLAALFGLSWRPEWGCLGTAWPGSRLVQTTPPFSPAPGQEVPVGLCCAVLFAAVLRAVGDGRDRELGFLCLLNGWEGLCIQLLYRVPRRPAQAGWVSPLLSMCSSGICCLCFSCI